MADIWKILDILLLLCLTTVLSEKITKTLMLIKSGNETNVAELWELGGGFNDPSEEKHLHDVNELFEGGTFRSREVDNWKNDTPSMMRMVVWNQHGDMLLTVVFDTHDSPQYRLQDWMTRDRILYSSNDMINNETAKVNFRYMYSQLSIAKVSHNKKVWFAVWDGDKTNISQYPEFLLAYSFLPHVNGPVMAYPSVKETSSAISQLAVNVSEMTSSVKIMVPYMTPGDTSPLYIIGITAVLTDTRHYNIVQAEYYLNYSYPQCVFYKRIKNLSFKDQIFITDGKTAKFGVIRAKCLKIQFLKPKKIPKSVMHVNLTYVTENTFFRATYLSFVGEYNIENATAPTTVVNIETTAAQSGSQTNGETADLLSSYNRIPFNESDFDLTTASQLLSTNTDMYNSKFLPQDTRTTPIASLFSNKVTTSILPQESLTTAEISHNHYWTINYDMMSSSNYFTQEIHITDYYSSYYTSDNSVMMSFPVSTSVTYSTSSFDGTSDSKLTSKTTKMTTTPTTPIPTTVVKVCCSVCNTGSDKTTNDPLSITPRQHDDLRLNKTCLSQYIRKRTSALDARPSAEGIGFLGAGILILVAGVIVAIDMLNALAKNKRQSKVRVAN